MKRLSLILLLQCSLCVLLFGVPATPEVLRVLQPDGTELPVLLRGDEFFHYTTTDDGYLVSRNEAGYYEYAEFTADFRIRSLGVRARGSAERTAADRRLLKRVSKPAAAPVRKNVSYASSEMMRFPHNGSPKSLVILAEFSNLSFKVANPQSAFTDLLNQSGYAQNGATGSARDYFIACSDSVFQPEFVVVGPVKLDRPYNYYGGNDANGNDKAPAQMIVDACRKADTLGVDFSVYDTDGDGYVDNVFVYYAGYNEAEGGPAETVWPHRWRVQSAVSIDGVRLNDYACTSELRSYTGTTMCGIGTFCHEFTHVFGFPDLYVTDYNPAGKDLGTWDIMSGGSYNNSGRTPPTYSAYERFYLGWLKPKVLSEPSVVSLSHLLTSNEACLLSATRAHNLNGVSPNPTQFFMIENRQKSGWDAYLPGSGLLITRINYNASLWNSNTLNNDTATLGVEIMAANPAANGTASDTYPGTRNVTAFFPTLKNGTPLNQPLTYISDKGGVITFRYDGGGDGFPAYEPFPETLPLFKTVQEQPSNSQVVDVNGKWLVDKLKVSLSSGENFQIATADAGEWGSAVEYTPEADSTMHARLFVRYFPEHASFSDVHRDTISIVLDKYTTYHIYLSGQSSRPVLVEVPVAVAALDTTSSSYTAAWEAAFDATGYYLSAYTYDSLGTGTVLTEEFTDFDVACAVDWHASFGVVNSTIYGNQSPSVVFDVSSDTLWTERYCFPITKISFWMHCMGAAGSVLCVDGYADGAWSRIDSVIIEKSMLRTTHEMVLPADNAFTQFRIAYQKKAGKLLFDDFTVHFADAVTYQCHHRHVNALSYTLEQLSPDTEYRYRVQATDKTEYYENITDFSNEIHVRTQPFIDTDPRVLTVRKNAAGGYEVQLQELKDDYHLYIYTLDGRLMADIEPTNVVTEVPALPANTIYVLKYSSVHDRSRKDPSAKLFYQ
ncbi:MAG: M6 family metalloprotease domain-containing protein [Paludibacteraceae bacterium]